MNFLVTWSLRLLSAFVFAMAMSAGGWHDPFFVDFNPLLPMLAFLLFLIQATCCLVLRFQGCIYFLIAYGLGAWASFHVLAAHERVFLLGSIEYGTWLAAAAGLSGTLLGSVMRMDAKL